MQPHLEKKKSDNRKILTDKIEDIVRKFDHLTPGYFLQTGPISLRLSKEQQAVVPKVVETKKGMYPSAVSASIA